MQRRGMMEGGQVYPMEAPTPVSWKEQVRRGMRYMPVLQKATSKKKAMGLNDRVIHGERIQKAADAQRLWSRLEEESPGGPYNPAPGFPDGVAQMAKYGMGYVRIALHETLAKAWARGRSVRRQCLHFGGTEEDLFVD